MRHLASTMDLSKEIGENGGKAHSLGFLQLHYLVQLTFAALDRMYDLVSFDQL